MLDEKTAVATEPQQESVGAHRRGLATFRAILSEDVEWQSFAAYPPSVHLAVLVGKPSESGPYVIRVRVPRGVKMMPHRHTEDRVYTVLAGVFYVALGDRFDAEKLLAYPPGSVIIIPGNTPHFHWAKSGEYVAQITAIGPLGFEYINPNDDPRTKNR
jgi:quercetin dioxygenase-like cupin family protein